MARSTDLVCYEILVLPILRLLAPLALQLLSVHIFIFLFRTLSFLDVANTLLSGALAWLRGVAIARIVQGLSSQLLDSLVLGLERLHFLFCLLADSSRGQPLVAYIVLVRRRDLKFWLVW